jgi:hypothetical protein
LRAVTAERPSEVGVLQESTAAAARTGSPWGGGRKGQSSTASLEHEIAGDSIPFGAGIAHAREL